MEKRELLGVERSSLPRRRSCPLWFKVGLSLAGLALVTSWIFLLFGLWMSTSTDSKSRQDVTAADMSSSKPEGGADAVYHREGLFTFQPTTGRLTVLNKVGSVGSGTVGAASGNVGQIRQTPTLCDKDVGDKELCLDYSDRILQIQPDDHGCIRINQTATSHNTAQLSDCIDFGSAHWYGLGEVFQQTWPVETWKRPLTELVAGVSLLGNKIGGVVERYLLSSAGMALHVDYEVPLFVSINASGDNKFCFVSKFADPYKFDETSALSLSYTICTDPTGENMTGLHRRMAEQFWSRPETSPHQSLLSKPIWSTWVSYGESVNQTNLVQLARDIVSHGFQASQIELDNNWTPTYGDFVFDTTKFPDASTAIAEIHAVANATVSVWMHPFLSLKSQAFTKAMAAGLLVKDPRGAVPALVTWWEPSAAGLLDFTNPVAVDWFLNRTNALKTVYGVDSFKFDAGETTWLPAAYKLFSSGVNVGNPDVWSQAYMKVCHATDNNLRQEVRVGTQTQRYGMLVRMLDKTTTWGYDNGLRTLIPSAFTFGLLGYPYILPDMVGGNAYAHSMDKTLYVRWLQVNVFLPYIQLSILPWAFDDTSIISISLDMLRLRESYKDMFERLAEESKRTGAPMVRPLWWNNSNDPITLTIDTQFLFGDTLLVAPVLEPGALSRNIYLPTGKWRDELTGKVYGGQMWLKGYDAPLPVLPYFSRL